MINRNILLCGSLTALLLTSFTACTSTTPMNSSSLQAPTSSVDNASASQDNATTSSDNHVMVTDIEGNTQDLADFAWAKKYPSLLDSFASRSEEELTGFSFNTIANENIVSKGEPYEFDIWGQTMSVTVQNVERGNDITCIPADKISQGERFLGTMEEGQEYLAVTLSLTNNGDSPLDLYLNNVYIRCSVDGQVAKGPIGSEAVTSDLPLLPDDNTNQFQVILEGGETGTYSILYYVNSQIETGDLYLYANFPGYGVSEVTTAFTPVSEQWLALE